MTYMSKMDRGLIPRPNIPTEGVRADPHGKVINIHRTEAARNTRYENRKASTNNDVTIGGRRIDSGHKTSIHLGNEKVINASSKQIQTLDWQKEYQAPLTARGELESSKREGRDITPPVRAGGYKKDCSVPEFGAGGASYNANLQNHIKEGSSTPRVPRGVLGTKSTVEFGNMRQSYDDFRKEKKSYEGQIERTTKKEGAYGTVLRVKDNNRVGENQVAGSEKVRNPSSRFEAPHTGQE